MSRSMKSVVLGAAALALVAAPFALPVIAKDTKATAAVMNNLLACRGLPDAERLACYDKAVNAFDLAQKSGDIVVVDREKVREAKRDVFGFNVPTFGKLFEHVGGGKSEEVNEVTLTVDHAVQDAYGKWTIYMEGGQVWHSIESVDFNHRPHQGSQAVVRHGTIGSYLMKIEGESSFKAHRDD